jgi:indole-3-glycerol phosphate synthase
MSALTKIVADKYFAVEQQKGQVPVSLLERSVFFEQPAVSLKSTLSNPQNLGIIAEYKRNRPQKALFTHPTMCAVLQQAIYRRVQVLYLS